MIMYELLYRHPGSKYLAHGGVYASYRKAENTQNQMKNISGVNYPEMKIVEVKYLRRRDKRKLAILREMDTPEE